MTNCCTTYGTTHGYQELDWCIKMIKDDVIREWAHVRSRFPFLESFDHLNNFLEHASLPWHPYGSSPAENIFLHIAEDYSRNDNCLSAELILLLAKDLLGNFHRNRCYMPELSESLERWNCIVKGFLQTMKMHAGGCYDFGMIYKLIRAAIEKESRTHQATGEGKTRLFNEEVDVVHINDHNSANNSIIVTLIYQEYAGWLQENLRDDEWEMLERRCIFDDDCQTYASQHDKTYEASKKLFTRVKSKAAKMLFERFPDIDIDLALNTKAKKENLKIKR